MPKCGRVWRVGKWAGIALGAGCLVLWVMTIRLPNRHGRNVGYRGEYWNVYASDGALRIVFARRNPNPASMRGWSCRRLQTTAPEQDSIWHATGLELPMAFRWEAHYNAFSMITVPFWIPLFVLAVAGAIAYRKQRRAPAGHCRRCGYDLTKNESGICPECGVVCAPVEQRDGSQFRRPSVAE